MFASATYRVALTPLLSQLFESDELVLQSDGTLQKQFRVVGTNKVGMLAWHVMMRTPEYPEGREIVVIANDVTFQSGSFGVAEVCKKILFFPIRIVILCRKYSYPFEIMP